MLPGPGDFRRQRSSAALALPALAVALAVALNRRKESVSGSQQHFKLVSHKKGYNENGEELMRESYSYFFLLFEFESFVQPGLIYFLPVHHLVLGEPQLGLLCSLSG